MYNVVIFKINYGAESFLPARGDLLYRVMAVGRNVQCPPLHHSFKGVQLDAEDRPSFPDQFIDPAGVTVSYAAPPADRSKEECTSHNRPVEDLQHLAAHVEGSQLPQKIESAHPLLVHSVSVDPPVQPIV